MPKMPPGNMPEADGCAALAPAGAEPHGKPDIQAIMAGIRERVRAETAKHKAVRPPMKPYRADGDHQASRPAGDLFRSEDLRYLNQHHDYASKLRIDTITTHRRGLIGKILVRAKQKFLRMLRYSLLKDYFASEAEFHVGVVRLLNETATYIDARDGAIFWELIRKIDYDVTKALERIERINDEQTASLRMAERDMHGSFNKALSELSDRLGLLEASAARQAAELNTLDSVARGLEGIVAGQARLKPKLEQGNGKAPAQAADYSYVLLENRYRGGQAEIRKRLELYPPLFGGAAGPVLDLGCGRGELLELMREAGVEAYGVDIDQAMVAECKTKGLAAQAENGLEHLRSLEDRSLGGVIAIQVVEHLDRRQIQELCALCRSKVQTRGRVVFETVNPASLSALSSNYFRDPTHVFPLHPDTLSYAMTLAGLKLVELKMLSPFPPEALLREVPVEDYMTPRWARLVSLINHNLKRLNELLYGYQDFCVIGEAP